MVAGGFAGIWFCKSVDFTAKKMGNHDRGLSQKKRNTGSCFFTD